MNDSELLQLFVRDQNQRAFADLVRRHIDLVYSAALRHVPGDVHAAQDITQLVFLDLAAKARRLVEHPCLAGWLYASARFTALNTIRREQRRTAREKEVETVYEKSTAAADWDRVRPVIDDALQELDPRDHELVVRRFFDRQSFGTIAEQFGLTENAAQKAVGRALDVLSSALARRGIASTASALALALGNATSATPAVVVKTVLASTLTTIGGPATTSWLGGLKIAAAAALMAGISAGVGYWTGAQRQMARDLAETAAQDGEYRRQLDEAAQQVRSATARTTAAETETSTLLRAIERLKANSVAGQSESAAPEASQTAAAQNRNTVKTSAYVIGQIRDPGRINVGEGMSLQDVVEKLGGFTPTAKRSAIKISRHNADGSIQVLTIDGAANDATFIVLPEDTVYVPEKIL